MAENKEASYTSTIFKKHVFQGEGELNAEKADLWKLMVEQLEKCETVWNAMAAKHNTLKQLLYKQTEVQNLCSIFSVASKNPSVLKSIKAPQIFARIDQQGKLLIQKLEGFEMKAFVSSKIINDFNRDMQTHAMALMSRLTTVEKAKTLKELAAISVQNSDWILELSDPETDSLANEWDEMRLHFRILQVLEELSQIVPGYVVMDLWKKFEALQKS